MKKLFSMLMVLALLASLMVSVPAMAAGGTMTLQAFVDAVVAGNGTFDGNGVTVKWTAVSGCRDNRSGHTCKVGNVAATIETPNRIQLNCAQYHLFSTLNDISISNVNFDFTLPTSQVIYCHNGTWDDGSEIKTAVLQYENTGDVTYTNCTFNRVAVRAWRNDANDDVTTISDCDFSNVYSYALKDIRTSSIIIDNSSFTDCDNALLANIPGDVEKVQITNSAFTNVNAGDSKLDHLVQFNSAGDYSDAEIIFSNNTSSNSGAMFCILNSSFDEDIVSSDVPVTYPEDIKESWKGSNTQHKPAVTPCTHPNGKLTGYKAATTEAAGYTGDYHCPDCLHSTTGVVIPQISELRGVPQTGDESNILLWVSLMALSAAAFVVLGRKTRFN